jgi:hypothetical protein
MWETVAVATASVAVGGLVVGHRARRSRLYRELAETRRDLPEVQGTLLDLAEVGADQTAAFAALPIARVPGVLTSEGVDRLAAEALANRPLVERSFIPTHKQGGTISYENIHRHAPLCLSVFHSPALRAWLSRIVGVQVMPTADHDQSSCSLLVYTEAGDHIDWHFDHNFYRGRHFTVLICLINRGAHSGLSAGRLLWRDLSGGEHEAPLGPGDLVIFEGARIRHKATPLHAGDLRAMLSMTFATDPRIAPGRDLVRRVKDTAFYGIRALWD